MNETNDGIATINPTTAIGGTQKLATFCANGIVVGKDAENPYFNSKYAPLDAVVEVLKEPLAKAGIGYLFEVSFECVTISVIDLDNGHIILSSRFPFGEVKTPQNMGAAISYAKRYLLKTVFNVIEVNEDDDGNEASGIQVKTKPALPKKAPKTIEQQVNDEVPSFF